MDFIKLLLYFVITVASTIFIWLHRHFSYWQRRGVPHNKPLYFYGNIYEHGRTKFISYIIREVYEKYKSVGKFAGFYFGFRRAIVVSDLDLIKTILVKDFNSFNSRGKYYNEKDDPLSAHIFNLDGQKWRSMRTKLTPTFTSGKMKTMFPILLQVTDSFIQTYNELITEQQTNSIEVKDLAARFTTDVIGSCVFGVETNSLKEPNNEFRVNCNMYLLTPRHGILGQAFLSVYPNLARKLGIKYVNDEISDFFNHLVRETVLLRERDNIKRNDFMNLLIELKNQGGDKGLTIGEVAAQSYVFFVGGFETSSSTMGFFLYEMAINQDIQVRARAEINSIFEKYNGVLTYEGMRELKYVYQVFYETLRHYPIASYALRVAVNDYVIPNTKFIIKKNTYVIVPIDAIHHDPAVYPNPMKFDPDRFTPEEIQKRHPCAYIPFGYGPRNCIAYKFGEMQAIVGLAHLLRNFHFSPSKDTKIPLEFAVNGIALCAKGGIHLKVKKI